MFQRKPSSRLGVRLPAAEQESDDDSMRKRLDGLFKLSGYRQLNLNASGLLICSRSAGPISREPLSTAPVTGIVWLLTRRKNGQYAWIGKSPLCQSIKSQRSVFEFSAVLFERSHGSQRRSADECHQATACFAESRTTDSGGLVSTERTNHENSTKPVIPPVYHVRRVDVGGIRLRVRDMVPQNERRQSGPVRIASAGAQLRLDVRPVTQRREHGSCSIHRCIS